MTNVFRNALSKGYRLGWYEIVEVLGQGGFGITYLAANRNLDRLEAVKEYLPREFAVRGVDGDVSASTENDRKPFRAGLQGFIKEARTLAKFKHPNIVQVYNIYEAKGTAYMAMEYEQGESLDKVLKSGRFIDEDSLRPLAETMMDALSYMHDQRFVHRDVKPGNIFIRSDGAPVLLDFGSARLAMGEETRTLTAMVSRGYAPFEQYHGEKGSQGPWTDIYALGATLYRAVTGRAPVDAQIRVKARVEGSPDPLIPARVAGAGRFSNEFLAGIDCSLAFLANERPQDIREWRAGFAGVGDSRAKIVAKRDASPAVGGDRKPGRRAAATAAAGILAVALAVGVWYFMRESGPTGSHGVESYRTKVTRADEGTPASEREPISQDARSDARKVEHGTGKQAQPLTARKDREPAGEANERESGQQSGQQSVSIAELLKKAEAAWDEGHLNGPGNETALTYFRAILDVQPAHPAARAGVQRIADSLAEQVDDRIAAAELADAERLLQSLQQISPGSKAVELRQQTLSKARAEGDRQAAEALLERQRQQRISALLTKAEAAINALRLTSPSGDNAQEYFRAVAEIEPDHPAVGKGRSDIAARYADLAKNAFERNQFDKAEGFVEKALRVLPDHEEAASLAGDISLAREQAEAAAQAEQQRLAQLERAREEQAAKVAAKAEFLSSVDDNMVPLAAGCFNMGSSLDEKSRNSDEAQHEVCLPVFAIGRYEITFAQYDYFVQASGRARPQASGWGRGKRPVINVTWDDAAAFAEWLSAQSGRRYRLPTEAEWEYAARAGTTWPFYTGPCINTRQANYNGDHDYANCGAKTGVNRKKTLAVGTLSANPWGLFDMHGNVWEWTCSRYDKPYDGAETRCVAGTAAGRRVLRGGSWSSNPKIVRSANRYKNKTTYRYNHVGFRLVRD